MVKHNLNKSSGAIPEINVETMTTPGAKLPSKKLPGTGPRLLAVEKCGLVSLLQHNQNQRYYAGWWKPETRRFERKALKTKDREQALGLCWQIDAQLRGNGPTMLAFTREHAPLSITEALEFGERHSSAESVGRKSALRLTKGYFLAWIRKEFPNVITWDSVLPYHVRQYVKYLKAKGHKPNGIVMYLSIISLTNTALQENYPQIYAMLPTSRLVEKDHKVTTYLNMKELLYVIGTAHEFDKKHAVYALMLSGLSGLRHEEACRIRPSDLKDGCLTITKTKNRASVRVIPLLPEVEATIREAFASRDVMTMDADAQLYEKPHLLRKEVRQVLDACHFRTKNTIYKSITPHEAGRTTYMNILLKECGVGLQYLQAMCGHSPGSTAETSYVHIRVLPQERDDVKRAKLDVLRREAVEPLAKLLSDNYLKSVVDLRKPMSLEDHA